MSSNFKNKDNNLEILKSQKSEKQQNAQKQIYECISCKYQTIRLGNYKKHLATQKHNNRTKTIDSDVNTHICCCGRTYMHKQSLNNHKKRCQQQLIEYTADNEKDIDYKEMMTLLIKQNKQLISHIGEIIPKIGNTNSNNTNSNNVKQKFNINVFLNEECKDALTMNEFIDKIKVTLDNLIITKDKGIMEGISTIFIENMNKLSLYERPIHCTDVKRETVYIKCGENTSNENMKVESGWEKDKENKKIKEALSKVSHMQWKALGKWVDKHPNWQNNSKEQEEYMLLISKCTSDIVDNKHSDKALKRIYNEAYVGEDKTEFKN